MTGHYENRRIVRDTTLVNSVLVKLKGTAYRRGKRQLTRIEDIKARANSTVTCCAKHIPRKKPPGLRRGSLFSRIDDHPVERTAVKYDSKTHGY